ncbi:hypothetical protein ACFL5V_05805 [Fibrobacterota bacterium]
MKESRQSLISLSYPMNSQETITMIEGEVKKFWDDGWVFVKAEPDKLLESVCLYFEREIHVE